jgi:hypothetical protein
MGYHPKFIHVRHVKCLQSVQLRQFTQPDSDISNSTNGKLANSMAKNILRACLYAANLRIPARAHADPELESSGGMGLCV